MDMLNSQYGLKVGQLLSVSSDSGMVLRQFCDLLQSYEDNPKPIQEVYNSVSRLFNHDPELLSGFEEFMLETYPAQNAHVFAAQAEREEAHRLACEQQSQSPLLSLPREIRDKIWDEVKRGNVVHVSPKLNGSRQAFFSKRRRKARSYCFHACRAENGAESSACPPGVADHAHCQTAGPSNYPDIRLVCKQFLLEFPGIETMFFSHNAFQFADLETAHIFLFKYLSEPQRSALTHLKLAIPYNIASAENWPLWLDILNYFSNPWERTSLHMYPEPQDKPELLTRPIYFYYSNCYYESNKDRLHQRYQVGRGDTSWDVGISDLKYKGEPKLDLAMNLVTDNETEHGSGIATWGTDFERPAEWCKPLLQFRQYDGLKFQLYNEEGITSTSEFETFTAALKEQMVEPVIGPRKCMFFAGEPYGNGTQNYAWRVGSN